MCEIAGVLAFEDSPFAITGSYIYRMRDTMVHHGPDGKGTWISEDGKCGLGHRRQR